MCRLLVSQQKEMRRRLLAQRTTLPWIGLAIDALAHPANGRLYFCMATEAKNGIEMTRFRDFSEAQTVVVTPDPPTQTQHGKAQRQSVKRSLDSLEFYIRKLLQLIDSKQIRYQV